MSEAVSLRSEKPAYWLELGGDGQSHQVHDPARIPSHLLINDQVKALQAEVIRLRQKSRARREAIRDANRALERYQRLAMRRLGDRNDLQEGYDDLFERYQQCKQAKKCECGK